MVEFHRNGIIAACVLIAAISPSLLAQSERGTISGTVRDSTGAVVPGAAIKVINTATNLVTSLVSNDSGDYIAASLPVGNYTVSVSKSGFRAVDLKGITVDAATSVRGDVTLEVGQAMQTIEIQASAASLQTEDAKASVTINQRLVNDLPL